MIPVSFQVVLLCGCMLAEAFFSGMETGVISVNRLRLLHRVRNGVHGARIIEEFLRDTNRLLGTTLVGTNLCIVSISTIAASLADRFWGARGQAVGGVLVSLLLLVFCEYLPKAWFNSRPLERCLPLARLLRAAEWLLKPLGLFIVLATDWVSPRGKRKTRNPFVTREHLQLLTRDSEAGGQISAFERLMINRVLDLQLKTASDIMTPLAQVSRVQASAPLSEAVDEARRCGHMKLPVFDDTGETCLGVFHVQDLRVPTEEWTRQSAAAHMQPPFFLSAGARADDVLPLLRRNRRHIAVVRDDANRAIGIVTVENVLKVLVGNLPASASAQRKADRTVAKVESVARSAAL